MNWVQQSGIEFWTGVPCSRLARQWDCADPVGAAHEGQAVAMACGAWLGGRRGGVLMQSSGLGNAVNPLTSLCVPYSIPVLLVISLRCDEPQHELMGSLTPDLLDRLAIERADFPGLRDNFQAALADRRSYALLLREGPSGHSSLSRAVRRPEPVSVAWLEPRVTRREMLEATRHPDDLLIATTGFTGRELLALGEGPNQFAMAGSMGCALSLGLGLALCRPERRVVVLDGDGGLLMQLGSLATCGHYAPPNLVHLVLDNGCHDSTGGQPTASGSVDFCGLAAAAGYPEVVRLNTPEALRSWLASRLPGPGFAHLPILPGRSEAPRPSLSPPLMAARFREFACS